ncbi:MAG TPA: ATP-binding cassette domain-containing protein [Rectinemataceae bacterium]|nr:ATP-binding cassette domain-containing protein [Rectinemataceae bacterium]
MIALKKVAKALPAAIRGVEGLSGIDLSINRGDFLLVAAPSEWTRAALLNIIGLLDEPDSGSYEFDGREILGLGDRERAKLRSRRFGFVFREPRLLEEYDIEGNLTLPMAYAGMPRHLRARRARELLDRVGLETANGKRCASLSSREARLASIARALANDPTCLLVDDSGLTVEEATFELLVELHGEGLTIVVASPSETLIRYLPDMRVVRIDKGRMVNIQASTTAGVAW